MQIFKNSDAKNIQSAAFISFSLQQYFLQKFAIIRTRKGGEVDGYGTATSFALGAKRRVKPN